MRNRGSHGHARDNSGIMRAVLQALAQRLPGHVHLFILPIVIGLLLYV